MNAALIHPRGPAPAKPTDSLSRTAINPEPSNIIILNADAKGCENKNIEKELI